MHLIDCDLSHGDTILAIYNEAILTSSAMYEYHPRTPEMIAAWFESKRRGNFPVFGLAADSGELMGFASYGPFRLWPAYKYTVEHSVYVATPYRGRGLGRVLLAETIRRAKAQGYHVLIGAIDSGNATSIRLHESLGFQRTGLLPQVGFKFGRWLDLVLYQLILETPENPVDG